MYSIKCDGQLIYAPLVVNDGYIVINATVKKELNRVDSCEFTIPTIGAGYDSIQKLKSVITVYDGDEKIFHGRCINITKDFYNNRKFYCEGELGYLNDSILRPYAFSAEMGGAPDTPGNIFKYYIMEHNARVDAAKRFVVGDISTMQSEQIVRESTQYPTTLDEMQEKLIETYGGYVMPRYVGDRIYLDYKKVSGGDNGQIIQFGQNLLKLEEYVDAGDVKTVIIPVGATVEGTDEPLTIKSVNDGRDYLESATAIALFGRIEECIGWDEITDATALKTAGQARLSELIKEAITLNLSAIDLSLLDVDADRIRVGEYNRVLSLPHGIDDFYQCTRMTLNLSDPKQNEYTFGNPKGVISEQVAAIRSRAISISDISTIIGG